MVDDERPEQTTADEADEQASEELDGSGPTVEDAAADEAQANELGWESAVPPPSTSAGRTEGLSPRRAAKLAGIAVTAAVLIAAIVVAAAWIVSAINDDGDDCYGDDYYGIYSGGDGPHGDVGSYGDEAQEPRDSGDDEPFGFWAPAKPGDDGHEGRRKGPLGAGNWGERWDWRGKDRFGGPGRSGDHARGAPFGFGRFQPPVVVVVLGGFGPSGRGFDGDSGLGGFDGGQSGPGLWGEGPAPYLPPFSDLLPFSDDGGWFGSEVWPDGSDLEEFFSELEPMELEPMDLDNTAKDGAASEELEEFTPT